MSTRYTRGVWSLENVENKYPENDWVDIDNVALTPSESRTDICYWTGGAHSGSSINPYTDKTSFASNTTSRLPGSLYVGREYCGGYSSATNGYIAGKGNYPSSLDSKIHKIIYSTDTEETAVANLSTPRGAMPTGVNNPTDGYSLGGVITGSPWTIATTTVDKLTFSNDSAALQPSTQLVQQRMNATTSSNTEKSYITGGGVGNNGHNASSNVNKLDYSSGTITVIPGTLPAGSPSIPSFEGAANRGSGSTNGAGTVGYYIGGMARPSNIPTSFCYKHVYSTDTISEIPGGRMYTARHSVQGSGNNTYALTAGGYSFNPSSGGAHFSSVDRMSYSSETSSRQPGLNQSMNRKRGTGFGPRTYAAGTTYDGAKIRWKDSAPQTINWGVFIGGNPGGGSSFDRIDFTSETMELAATVPSGDQYRHANMGSSLTKGYLMMGQGQYWPNSNGFSYIWKYTYATDTVGSPTPNSDIRGIKGTTLDSQTSTNVFSLAGNEQGNGRCCRVVHSTDATSLIPSLSAGNASPSGPASQSPLYDSAGVSNINANVGYAAGGTSPSPATPDVHKFEFATDTRSYSSPAALPERMRNHAGVGGPSKGYFYGGDHYSYSYVYGLDYSTETSSTVSSFSPRKAPDGSDNSSVNTQPQWGGGTGNNVAGYFYGGYLPGGTSNANKITYSTDTASNLFGVMRNPSGASPYYERYIQAGSTAVRESNRPNLIGPFPDATPTPNKSPKPFATSDTVYFSGGLTSSTAGYPPTPPAGQTLSNTDKLTMASETVAAAPGANLVTGKYFATAFSSTTNAYIAGGFNNPSQPNPTSAGGAIGGAIQTCDKITYATDTMSRMPNTDHCSGAMWQGAGNGIKGYWAGRGNAGSGGSYGSETDKLTFATDTIQGLNTPGFDRGHGGVGVYEGPGASGGGGIYFAQGESGYTWGPSGGSNSTSTRVMRTSTETGMDVPSLSMLPFAYVQSWSNPTHWMVQGGWTGPAYSVSPGVRSSASKTTWATETDSELPSSTGQTLSGAGSAGNNTYGYAGGGRTTSPGDKRSYTMRYTFESDTFEFRPSTHLTEEKKFVSGTSAKEHTNPDPYYVSTPNVI
tara:strand:+ start:53 stop:3319 length:3267 start_codon:yes stop_codon:yes gene_type:complete